MGGSEGDWLRPMLLDGLVHSGAELVGDIREAEVEKLDTPATLRGTTLVEMRLRGRYLNYRALPERPQKQISQPWVIAATRKSERKPHKPSKDHPWRSLFINKRPEISKSLKP